ncbi:hypothetical protein CAEBREN_32205 [Caenorhabditis brenneri]|uniref:Chromo domain-containing protein n=1 Tax=Caenorhabditis brenneri TaxID=135651 RepID=G0MAC1_CAEBE|nr:hypothetical protein CAEBREN_32205 [Caenorhabditis brenneri]
MAPRQPRQTTQAKPAQKKNDVWEVERIVNKRRENGRDEYRVKWKGFPSSQNTWEPRQHLNCDVLLRQFEATLSERQNRARPRQQALPASSSQRVPRERNSPAAGLHSVPPRQPRRAGRGDQSALREEIQPPPRVPHQGDLREEIQPPPRAPHQRNLREENQPAPRVPHQRYLREEIAPAPRAPHQRDLREEIEPAPRAPHQRNLREENQPAPRVPHQRYLREEIEPAPRAPHQRDLREENQPAPRAPHQRGLREENQPAPRVGIQTIEAVEADQTGDYVYRCLLENGQRMRIPREEMLERYPNELLEYFQNKRRDLVAERGE